MPDLYVMSIASNRINHHDNNWPKLLSLNCEIISETSQNISMDNGQIILFFFI